MPAYILMIFLLQEEKSMSQLLPDGELVRRAAEYVAQERGAHGGRSLMDIVDEAGMRFNLSPLEAEALIRLFGDAPFGYSSEEEKG